MSRAGHWSLIGLALLAFLGGCSDEPEPDAPADAPEVQLSFTQLLPDEGTSKGLLRVVNESDEPLPVTGAGLQWSGYGDFVDPQDVTLAPGQTLDLHVLLPTAQCDQGDEPIVGVVATPTGTAVQPLTSSGQRFLRHLWLRRCQADLVNGQVAISYGSRWRIRTVRGEPAAVGALVLERRGGDEPVRVEWGSGSVLYDVEVPDPVTADPDVARTLVPLWILPGNRCDEHARGQATAPFTFRVGVRVGDTPTQVLVPPPVRVQELATEVLDRTCDLRATRS